MAALGGKTAFVFSGGGSLGAIQVGMLRVLLSYGLKPDFVVGASVGVCQRTGRRMCCEIGADLVGTAARGHFSFYPDQRFWPDQASRIHRRSD